MSKSDFAALHRAGDPVILFNAWDAGSALAVEKAGAKAIATGSHSLAGAQGYADGEAIPLAQLLMTTRQIADAITVPLTVDFEAGFADDLDTLAKNGYALIEAGAVGCNLEDQLIGADDIRDIDEQARRIEVLVNADLFVNARTDTFLIPLRAGENPNSAALVDAAIARGHAYASAGAACFFIPGLSDPAMIAEICQAVDLPVNVMRMPDLASNGDLAKLGVARISYGGAPWHDAMASVEAAAKAALAL